MRFFRDVTEKSVRRGVFRSIKELTEAIETYIAAHKAVRAPLLWTASDEDILEKVKRGGYQNSR